MLGRLSPAGGPEHRVLFREPRLVVQRSPWGRSALAQATEHAAARLVAREARGQVARPGLADPAVVLGTGRAQVADLVPVAARREVPLGALTLEDGAPADIAADGVVNGPELLLHAIKVSQAFTASFSSCA